MIKTEDIKSPPLKSHTFYLASTPATSHKLQSTPLPAVSSTPSLSARGSLHSPTRPALHSGRAKASSKLEKRGVRWTEDKQEKGKMNNSLRRDKTSDAAAQMWARYTQTVTPKFTLFEPKSSIGWKRPGESDEDGCRCFLKLSLPCTTGCNLCVYSRQLGPVRVYFSTTRKPNSKLLPSGRRSEHNLKNDRNNHHELHTAEEGGVNGDRQLKHPVQTSPEVIVPQIMVLPAEDRGKNHAGPSCSFDKVLVKRTIGNFR